MTPEIEAIPGITHISTATRLINQGKKEGIKQGIEKGKQQGKRAAALENAKR